MSPNGDDSLNSGAEGPKPVRRRQTGVRTLLVLVACCGAVFAAWRYASENYDPERVEARAIQERAIGTLRSGKPAERLTAITELVRLRHGDGSVAILPLIGALEDPDQAVRVAAAEGLDSIGPEVVKSGSGGGETIRAAAAALIRCSKDSDQAVRVAAVKAQGLIIARLAESGFGGETVRASTAVLISSLKDPEAAVRSAAITSLGLIASPRLTVMAHPPIERTTVMATLAEMIGDRDVGVRRSVINVMVSTPRGRGEPPPVLREGLKDESAENRAAAVYVLTSFSQGLDPWVPVLLRLAEHDPSPSVREMCVTRMNYTLTPPAVTSAVVPALITSLKSKNVKVRGQAALILGKFGADSRPAIPDLLRILNEPLDPHVSPMRGPSRTLDPACEAASALGRVAPGSAKAKEVIAALIEVARSGPVGRRGWAAYALGQFGPAAAEAVPVLIKMLKDVPPDDTLDLETYASRSLGIIAPDTPLADEAVAALLPVLHSKSWNARYNAIEALLQFGPKAAAALPRIRELENDRDDEVKAAATKAVLVIENGHTP